VSFIAKRKLMKAVIWTRYGPPDLLQIKTVKRPTPEDNEVLIKIYATTVNRTDCDQMRAYPFIWRFFEGLFKPKRPTLGTEFAGEIEVVGKKVSSFKVGDRVYGFSENTCGTHAQYMTISEDKPITTIPKDTTYEEAAASSEGAWYGYNFINKVELKKGQKVLINGATGGIGSAVVQLSKYYGADITGVCRSKHSELVRSLGAERVIDYTKEDFTKDDQKYDYVFDTVGKSSFRKCKRLLKPRGVYISCELGFLCQNVYLPFITAIFRGRRTKFPIPTDCRGTILLIKKLIKKGKFKTVIDREYPLEQIVKAFKYVEKGQKVGNVVITVDHNDNT